MKDALLLTYHFTERFPAGSVRAQSLQRYLAGHGWRTHVVNASPPAEHPAYDPAHGTVTFAGDPAAADVPTSAGTGPSIPGGGAWQGHLRRVVRSIVPVEREMTWARAVWQTGRQVAQQHPIQAVLTTCPPYGWMAFGHALARALGVPHVIDLRDDWAGTPQYAALTPVSRALLDAYAGYCVRRSAAVTVAGPRALDKYDAFGVPVHLVRNGFLEEHFEGVPLQAPAVPAAGPLRIVHLGWLYHARPVAPLLQALARLQRERPDLAAHVRLEQYGLIEADQWADVQGAGLEDIVTVHQQVPHHDALDVMQSADVLLCVASMNTPTAIPGKLYEYLRARRPVWLLADDCSSRDVAADVGLLRVDAPDDVDALYARLHALLEAKRAGALCAESDPDAVMRYSRHVSAATMADVLTTVAQTSPTLHPA